MAPKGTRGRRKFFEAIQTHYDAGGQTSASKVVHAHYEVNRKFSISINDIAHFDLVISYGLLVNTVPASSWAIFYLFSDPELLAIICRMIADATNIDLQQTDISGHFRINIATVIARCPLLSSFVRATLRVQSTNAAARIILRDTLLEDRYLLKIDALLFISSEDVHGNGSVWGPTAKTFSPKRFWRENNKPPATKTPASAYRAFGSGGSVCPGGFLATNEILTMLIIMVLRHDLRPAAGQWIAPRSVPHITKSILTPVGDIPVVLTERENVKGATWDFYWDSHEAS